MKLRIIPAELNDDLVQLNKIATELFLYSPSLHKDTVQGVYSVEVELDGIFYGMDFKPRSSNISEWLDADCFIDLVHQLNR